MKNINKQSGLIRTIIIIIIAIIVLSFLGYDLQSIVEADQTQSNLGYVWALITTAWDRYLARPVTYLWNDIFLDILWASFVDNLQRLRDGGQSDLQLNTPSLEF